MSFPLSSNDISGFNYAASSPINRVVCFNNKLERVDPTRSGIHPHLLERVGEQLVGENQEKVDIYTNLSEKYIILLPAEGSYDANKDTLKPDFYHKISLEKLYEIATKAISNNNAPNENKIKDITNLLNLAITTNVDKDKTNNFSSKVLKFFTAGNYTTIQEKISRFRDDLIQRSASGQA